MKLSDLGLSEQCVSYNKIQIAANHIFNPTDFFLLTGAKLYCQAIYILITYFAGYEDNIFKVSPNFHVQKSEVGGKSEILTPWG